MLYIDDARAGQHREVLHKAAYRFWQMHLKESFYIVVYNSADPALLEISIRTHRDRHDNPLTVELGSDPEEAILAALNGWWLERLGQELMN